MRICKETDIIANGLNDSNFCFDIFRSVWDVTFWFVTVCW